MSSYLESSATSSLIDETWISWFCGLHGNNVFCEIDKQFIEDSFNLFGLKNFISKDFNKVLYTILDRCDYEDDDEEELSKSACLLYGMIHARYIITTFGLSAMQKKYLAAEFGECPRTYCHGQAVLPIGLSDEPNKGPYKLFCPKCRDLYNCPPQQRHIDGAVFGTTFAHIFLMTYEDLVPTITISSFTPKIFGFKIHPSSNSVAKLQSFNTNNKTMNNNDDTNETNAINNHYNDDNNIKNNNCNDDNNIHNLSLLNCKGLHDTSTINSAAIVNVKTRNSLYSTSANSSVHSKLSEYLVLPTTTVTNNNTVTTITTTNNNTITNEQNNNHVQAQTNLISTSNSYEGIDNTVLVNSNKMNDNTNIISNYANNQIEQNKNNIKLSNFNTDNNNINCNHNIIEDDGRKGIINYNSYKTCNLNKTNTNDNQKNEDLMSLSNKKSRNH